MRAVIFDLYETLITENHPEWFGHPSLAERLGLDEEVCRREWRLRHQGRMTGQIPDHGTVLQQICEAAGVSTPMNRIKGPGSRAHRANLARALRRDHASARRWRPGSAPPSSLPVPRSGAASRDGASGQSVARSS